MPAITACLIVSVLRISIATCSSPMSAPKLSAIEFQVSEPFSRTTKGSLATRAREMPGCPTSRWPGGATMT